MFFVNHFRLPRDGNSEPFFDPFRRAMLRRPSTDGRRPLHGTSNEAAEATRHTARKITPGAKRRNRADDSTGRSGCWKSRSADGKFPFQPPFDGGFHCEITLRVDASSWRFSVQLDGCQ
jgi:hypothetical protein